MQFTRLLILYYISLYMKTRMPPPHACTRFPYMRTVLSALPGAWCAY